MSSPTGRLVPEDAVGPQPAPPARRPVREVPVVESVEPLVELDDRFVRVNGYRRAGWEGTSDAMWLRRSVVDRLDVVAATLPDGFGLAIFDGWRSPATVRALYGHYYGPGSTLAPGFLADPDDPSVVPPHSTGAAVDLTLTWDGAPLSLGTPFDEFSPRAALDALESAADGPDVLDRNLRRLLCAAMTAAGFAPYHDEWWHYSWGDQMWAAWHAEPFAHHGATSPSR